MTDKPDEQRYQPGILSWLLLLFILTWTAMTFHSCMIKRRLERIEQQIQCR